MHFLIFDDLRHFVYALISLWMRCRLQFFIFLSALIVRYIQLFFFFYRRNSSNYAHVKYWDCIWCTLSTNMILIIIVHGNIGFTKPLLQYVCDFQSLRRSCMWRFIISSNEPIHTFIKTHKTMHWQWMAVLTDINVTWAYIDINMKKNMKINEHKKNYKKRIHKRSSNAKNQAIRH